MNRIPYFQKRFIAIVIFIVIFVFLSGCISPQKENSTNLTYLSSKSPVVTSTSSSAEKFWIRIDHIPDFQTDSTFNITGSTQINVEGTTNFPVGTPLPFVIFEKNESRDLLRTNIEVMGNNSGPNTFSYVYDMKGNPPGQYLVLLGSADSDFSITSDKPFYKWIHMNSIGDVHIGENIPVSGTTDLPAGSEITIRSIISYHSCPIPTPDKEGQRSFCGGSCRGSWSEHTVLVVEGEGGVNTWNSTVNTTDWCLNEEYRINAEAKNWTNVTRGGQSILT